MVTGEMSPYLLLGFLIAGVLHVFVPRRFYTRYLSKDNKWAVVWAALLGRRPAFSGPSVRSY